MTSLKRNPLLEERDRISYWVTDEWGYDLTDCGYAFAQHPNALDVAELVYETPGGHRFEMQIRQMS